MKTLEILVPSLGTSPVDKITSTMRSATPRLPFDAEVIEFIDAIAQKLFKDERAKQFPELQALAFFMRKSNLISLQKEFQQTAAPDLERVPLGRVLHIAPANIDTMFVYSWLLSALMGNINVVRISSSRSSEQTQILCEIINSVLNQFDELKATVAIVTYEHDEEVTAQLSEIIDMRVIWGGDSTVAQIRKVPLPPHARELTFPDRYSMTAVESKNYCGLKDNERFQIADQFFNDSYLFDQAACSSPRQIFWIGKDEDNRKASELFFAAINAILDRRKFLLQAGSSLSKMTALYDCVIDVPISDANISRNELAVLTVERNQALPAKHAAWGTFYSSNLSALNDLIPFLERRVQTLTYHGFSESALHDFVKKAAGKGVDRIVPIGQALQFNRFWDGMDLLNQYVRQVQIK